MMVASIKREATNSKKLGKKHRQEQISHSEQNDLVAGHVDVI